MQLRTARLCLDCDEVHDAPQCPVCASEMFTYMTRWVPTPERRTRPRPTTSPEADVYRRLIEPPQPASNHSSRGRQLLKHGVLGLTALGVVGWLWRTRDSARSDNRSPVAERVAGGAGSEE
jgi:hypothetical protein